MSGTFAASTSDAVRLRLRPSERIVWQGQPDVADFSNRGAWYLIPFSVLWCGFAILWEATAITSRGGVFFVLWGLPFVGVGLYMVFGRILVAREEARRTHYAVTDQRVLMVGGAFRRRIVEMALDDLPPAQLEVGKHGLGSITFGTQTSAVRLPPGWPAAGMYAQPLALMSIPDAERVYGLIQEAKATARRS